MSACPLVGVVVLNWRRPDDVLACLRSVGRLAYPRLEVAVVDNASANGSVAAIRAEFPNITLIENELNIGFAGGVNQGVSRLMDRGVEYVLLLNDDTEVAPDLVHRLVEVAESDPTIGILGPTIYYFQRPNVIWSAGGEVDRLGAARHLRLDQREDRAQGEVRDVDYVTGCGMLASRCLIEALGTLDERFFAYFEETEWCQRARHAGFRVVHVPRARMWHKIQSASRVSSAYLYLMARNRLLYLRCSGAGSSIVATAVTDLARTAARCLLCPVDRFQRRSAAALVWGIVDFMRGRYGPPPTWL